MADLVKSEKPSMIRSWYERLTGAETGLTRASEGVHETGLAIRQVGESVLVGAALGVIDGKGGLDKRIGNRTVPIDGVLAGVGILGSLGAIAMGHGDVAHDFRNAGTSAATVYAFRKARDLSTAKDKVSKSKHTSVASTVHGEGDIGADIGADPTNATTSETSINSESDARPDPVREAVKKAQKR